MKILLADDEKSIRITLGDALSEAGHQVTTVDNGTDALKRLLEEPFELLITDVRMPGIEGMELLSRTKAERPQVDVFVMTGHGSLQIGVDAMKRGANDFFEKPCLNEAVVEKVAKLAKARQQLDEKEEENLRLRKQIEKRYGFENLVGESPRMQEVYELVSTVSGSDCNVLIEGETGTGKEEIAKAIHWNSPRKHANFVAMACGTFPDTLLEDELFGHERGAYTDARDARIGRFEHANHGTIFIDEIDDMSLPTQVKLLRVLQERAFERIGGSKTIKVDTRVVAASKVSLEQMVRDQKFREDLFYRLHVVKIALPPLRERQGDVPLLVNHFIRLLGKDREYTVDPDVLEAMERFHWPGNVRQLKAAVERAIVRAGTGNKLRKEHLIPTEMLVAAPPPPSEDRRTLSEVVAAAEEQHIRRMLEVSKNHKGDTARILGISRKNLWEKMRQYGIE